MIEQIMSPSATLWALLGISAIAVETMVFGLATGVGLFAGLGAVATALLIWTGLIASEWSVTLPVFAGATAIFAGLFYKWFKRLQSTKPAHATQSSDLIGYRFRLASELSKTATGKTRYSGIEWRVELADESVFEQLSAGEEVEVCGVAPGLFRVRAYTPEPVEPLRNDATVTTASVRRHFDRLPRETAAPMRRQLATIEEQYAHYCHVLDARFNDGELTHARFKSLGEGLLEAMLRNLADAALHAMGRVNDSPLSRGGVASVARNGSTEEKLAQNRSALDELARTAQELAGTQTHAEASVARAERELEEMRKRLWRYSASDNAT